MSALQVGSAHYSWPDLHSCNAAVQCDMCIAPLLHYSCLHRYEMRVKEVDMVQEEAEEDYRRRFPDHFSTFADLADPDQLTEDQPGSMSDTHMTGTQAASAQAQALTQGEFLDHIMQLHMALFPPSSPNAAAFSSSLRGNESELWQPAFERAYDVGARLVQSAQGDVPWIGHEAAESLACGHLLRTCLTHQKLQATATPHTGGSIMNPVETSSNANATRAA